MMSLRKPLPPGRTLEQLRNHYEVERGIADRLKRADRDERKRIYETMYDDLFRMVPDHPRLTQRENAKLSAAANRSKMNFVRRFIGPDKVFVEFAPGDCRFASELCNEVRFVYGVDISDQRGENYRSPGNFKLIVYDGYRLDLGDDLADIVFSDQLIEHLHPEDVLLHLELVKRILKKGGVCAFRTPHCYLGPHDISGFFSDNAEGFHLREWTYRELAGMLRTLGYDSWYGLYPAKGKYLKLPMGTLIAVERVLGLLSPWLRRRLSAILIRSITMVAVK